MSKVPQGSFQMGDDGGNYRIHPAHRQNIVRPYWISVHPITNAQWKLAVIQSNGIVSTPHKSHWYNDIGKASHPVVWVDWHQCQSFVNWLGKGWRLLSEVEWEFAARGQNNRNLPNHNDLSPSSPAFFNKHDGPRAIGQYPKDVSWVGAEEMTMGVWEWTNSPYQQYPYTQSDLSISDKRFIVIRGNSVLNRLGRPPYAPYYNLGLRICIYDSDFDMYYSD